MNKILEFFEALELDAEYANYLTGGETDIIYDKETTIHFTVANLKVAEVSIDPPVFEHIIETMSENDLTPLGEQFRQRCVKALLKAEKAKKVGPFKVGQVADAVAAEANEVEVTATEWIDEAHHTSGSVPGGFAAPPEIDAKAFGVFDISMLTIGEAIPLRTADRLYQPVLSTSSGSRYFLVAASECARLAMRWRSGKLSVRLEGTALDAEWFRKNLKEVGFTTVSSEYASFHIELPENEIVIARKTVGSVCSSVWNRWLTPSPDVDVIRGLGS